MKKVIASLVILLSLAACEVSMPGVRYEGEFSPPDDWVMTPEAEALITPAEDGSKWEELTWSEWGKLRGREARSSCAILTPDNRVIMCDYIREEDKQRSYEHEVYHAYLKSLGIVEDIHVHSAEHWTLTDKYWWAN